MQAEHLIPTDMMRKQLTHSKKSPQMEASFQKHPIHVMIEI